VSIEHSLATRWGEPDLLHPSTRIATWFTRPAGVVTQLGACKIIDQPMVDYLINILHDEVRKRFDGVQTYALHDWSSIEDFDFRARTRLLTWCVAHRREFADSGIAHPPLSPAWKMAINVGKVTLDAGKFPFHLFPSVELGIEVLGLRRFTRTSIPPSIRCP
jgi:hypothetical protein